MAITEQVKQQLFGSDDTPIRLTPLPAAAPASKRRIRDRRRPGAKKSGEPWTKDEHERFLAGLQAFPSGPWKMVAAYVQTRTTRQTMTHAQKYRQKIKRRQHMARTAAPVAAAAVAAPTPADHTVSLQSPDCNTARVATRSQNDGLLAAMTTASTSVAADTRAGASAATLAPSLQPSSLTVAASTPVLAHTSWPPRATPIPTPHQLPSLHTSIQRHSSTPADLQSLQLPRVSPKPAPRDRQAYARSSYVAPSTSGATMQESSQQQQRHQHQQHMQYRAGRSTAIDAVAPAPVPPLRRTASHEAIAAILSNYATILDDDNGAEAVGDRGDGGDRDDLANRDHDTASGDDDDDDNVVHLSDRLCELFVDPNQL